MTEQEWLTCTDPMRMLGFLSDKVSQRKLRLFACACVQYYWSHLTDERSKRTLAVGEREADGLGSKKALRLAEKEAKAAIPALCLGVRPSEQAAAAGAMAVVNVEAIEAARKAWGWGRNVSFALAYEQEPGELSRVKDRAYADWDAEAVALLLDLFSTPFRPVALAPAWLASDVVKIAQATYEERAFDRLPILADSLEEAGCHNLDILDHLRGPESHVRGCWVVDTILGKK